MNIILQKDMVSLWECPILLQTTLPELMPEDIYQMALALG